MLQSPDKAARWEAVEKLERLDSRLAEEWYIHKLKSNDVQSAAQGLCRIGNDVGEMVTVKFPIRASGLPGDEEQARQARPLSPHLLNFVLDELSTEGKARLEPRLPLTLVIKDYRYFVNRIDQRLKDTVFSTEDIALIKKIYFPIYEEPQAYR